MYLSKKLDYMLLIDRRQATERPFILSYFSLFLMLIVFFIEGPINFIKVWTLSIVGLVFFQILSAFLFFTDNPIDFLLI